MSFKYSFLKASFRIVPVRKMMAKPYDQLLKLFKTERAKPRIPELSDGELVFDVKQCNGQPVLTIDHKAPSDSVCMYLAGGGMLKYPEPSQVKEVQAIAKATGRNIVLPYFPLCPKHDLFDAMDMIYEVYRQLTERYKPDNIAILGGSSGGYMALVLLSMINERREGLPMPGKVYAGSPGTTMEADERAAAEELNASDLVMSTTALDNIFVGMAGGKELPEYMLYTQRGNYVGLKSAFLSYGGDEVFSAAARSTAERLRSFGADVTLVVEQGMYHSYAAMPLVKEAQRGHQEMIDYLTV